MPLVLHLPAHLGPAPPLTRRLLATVAIWSSGVRLDARVLRDEARLRETDARLLADVGLTREDVARGALRPGTGR